LVLIRVRRGDRNGLNDELPQSDLLSITVSPTKTHESVARYHLSKAHVNAERNQDMRNLRDSLHWTRRNPAPPGASG
jgi:hypothetical protein